MIYGAVGKRALRSEELTLWLAFDKLQPIGDVRAEYHNGLLASVITNMSMKSMPQGKDVSPMDFMPLSVQRDTDENRAMLATLLGIGATVTTSKQRGE